MCVTHVVLLLHCTKKCLFTHTKITRMVRLVRLVVCAEEHKNPPKK
jgi:hypothetical protein